MMGPSQRKENPRPQTGGCSGSAGVASPGLAVGRRSTKDAPPVSHSTTTPARGPCSVFAPGGQPWTALPDLPRGLARDTFYAVMRAARGKDRTTAPDRVLADLGELSTRSVQRGLMELERLGLIARERHGHKGGRLILITIRLAGKPECTHSPKPSAPIRQDCGRTHSPAAASPLPGVKQGENAAPTGQPARSWPSVASEESPLPAPFPAALRFWPHLIPEALRFDQNVGFTGETPVSPVKRQ